MECQIEVILIYIYIYICQEPRVTLFFLPIKSSMMSFLEDILCIDVPLVEASQLFNLCIVILKQGSIMCLPSVSSEGKARKVIQARVLLEMKIDMSKNQFLVCSHTKIQTKVCFFSSLIQIFEQSTLESEHSHLFTINCSYIVFYYCFFNKMHIIPIFFIPPPKNGLRGYRLTCVSLN